MHPNGSIINKSFKTLIQIYKKIKWQQQVN
jgi:hypothetical protein